MVHLSLLRLWFLSLTHHAAAGLHSSGDHSLIFTLLGDDVTLPCGIPSIKSCSSINWTRNEIFGTPTPVMKAGRVTSSSVDCSLQIKHLVLDDARLYSCHNGAHNSNVSLRVLELSVRSSYANGTVELHCFLNTFKGYVPCKDNRTHITWSTDDDTPLNGNRFRIVNPSDCFTKLFIDTKPTDHRRKWKCRLSQNDEVKATITYTTTLKDGIEEVFVAVGESVSLSCGNTSSFGVAWAVDGGTLADDTSSTPFKGQTRSDHHVNKDSSLAIAKVSALHAGSYQCSSSTGGQRNVLNRIRLHILDVTSEFTPGGDNLTLTCVMTCAKECEREFDLIWSGSSQNRLQSSLIRINNTLTKRLFLPVSAAKSDEPSCIVHKEGVVMVSKKWRTLNPLQTAAWAALPLGLLMCIAAGLFVHVRWKQNKDSGNEQSIIGMTHVYEVMGDTNIEDRLQPRRAKIEAVTTSDSFYDLLQAVN